VARKPTYKVPFTENGSIMHYAQDRQRWPGYTDYYTPFEWKDPHEFPAVLTLDHSISGRSAKYVIWKAADGREFPMFVADLVEMIKTATIDQGSVSAFWYTAKRGANYGVRFVRNA
jgi:hypothetical protein